MMMFGEARRKPKTWRCHHSASETGVSPNRRSGRFVQIQMQRSWYRFHRQSGSHLKVLIVIAVRRHAIHPNSCLWNISVWQQHALTLLPSRKIWPHLACPHRRVFSERCKTATANVAAMLDGFKSVGTRATMSEIIGDRINIYMARGVGFYQLWTRRHARSRRPFRRRDRPGGLRNASIRGISQVIIL